MSLVSTAPVAGSSQDAIRRLREFQEAQRQKQLQEQLLTAQQAEAPNKAAAGITTRTPPESSQAVNIQSEQTQQSQPTGNAAAGVQAINETKGLATQKSSTSTGESALGGALQGAGAGASIGFLAGGTPMGVAAGAAIGGTIGVAKGILGAAAARKKARAEAEAAKHEALRDVERERNLRINQAIANMQAAFSRNLTSNTIIRL